MEYLVLPLDYIIKLTLAASIGSIIGLERKFARKDASLRTFMLISLGSCLYTIISLDPSFNSSTSDPARVTAQIVAGIGFLGAGVIFRNGNSTSGLTTAALMWFTGGIGIACGIGFYSLAIFCLVLTQVYLFILRLVNKYFFRKKP